MKCPKCGGEQFKAIRRYEVDGEGGFSDEPHVSSRLKTYWYCEKCGWYEGGGEGKYTKYSSLILFLGILLLILLIMLTFTLFIQKP